MPVKKATANISDAAVKKATGKTWRQWFSILDKAGAKQLSHPQIATLLAKDKNVSAWWSQMLTVGYEYKRKHRVVGTTAGAGFQIGVQQTLPLSAKKAWKLVLSPAGRKIWLGPIRKPIWKKGQLYKTTTGVAGEIRSLDVGKRLRLTHQFHRKPTTTLQLYFLPVKHYTSLRFHQEKLTSARERTKMKKHWQGVLTKLEKLASKT